MTDAPDVWTELRKTVREAHLLGAKFRIVGDSIEIDGDLPGDLKAALPVPMLRQYLGATRTDREAVEFLSQLGVAAVLVDDIAGAEAAMADLDGEDLVGIDVETAPCNARPEPVRLNTDGGLSAIQPKPNGDGLDPHRAEIQTLQLYGGTDVAFVFVGEALQHVINSTWIRQQHLVAHNAAFEIAFLRQHSTPPRGVKATHPVECTMQASGLLGGVWSRSLATTSLQFLDVEPPKTLQTSCWAAPRLSTGQLAYAAADAVLAHDLWLKMQPVLEQKGRLAAYALQRNAIPAVADLQLRGLGFDKEVHAQQVEVWARELAEGRRDYRDLTGNTPPTTPAEIRSWLTEVAGEWLRNWPKTATGELSTERTHLKRLALLDVPTVKPVLQMLAMAKLLSTFGPKLAEFINPITGRIHASYNIAGTKAGRFSASKPNLQQLPSAKAPDFRKAIVAAPGCVLVGGDWSQIELRAAAWISGDPTLTAVFQEGRDLHTETASAISGVQPDQVTKAQRAAAKAVNFGSIYGVGPRTLAENAFDSYGIDMSERDARDALDRFFARYPVLKRWMHQHANLCQVRNYVEIGVGRVVEAAWEAGGKLSFPQCCNLPVQGAAADAMLRAIAMVFRRLRGIRGGMVASVHDELLLEVAEDDAEQARQILQEAMVEAFELTFPGAPTNNVVDVQIGQTWRDLK